MEQPSENLPVFGIRVLPVETVVTACFVTPTPWGVEIVTQDGRHEFISNERISRAAKRIHKRMMDALEMRFLSPEIKDCTPTTEGGL